MVGADWLKKKRYKLILEKSSGLKSCGGFGGCGVRSLNFTYSALGSQQTEAGE